MKLISHRGNINGKLEPWENEPTYIDIAISKGYDVEVDVWYKQKSKGMLFLGHDEPLYEVPIEWFNERVDELWIHCKDIHTLEFFNNKMSDYFNYFFHDSDDATLTSHAWIWAHPRVNTIYGSIAVLPELNSNFDISNCDGICSDYIEKYKKYG